MLPSQKIAEGRQQRRTRAISYKIERHLMFEMVNTYLLLFSDMKATILNQGAEGPAASFPVVAFGFGGRCTVVAGKASTSAAALSSGPLRRGTSAEG